MAEGNGAAASEVSADAFKSAFAAVSALIRQEWPSIDARALDATGGDLDQVVELVAAKLERTKASVKKQLAELHALATSTDKVEAKVSTLQAMVDKLEARSREIAERVKKEMLPQAEERVRNNLWTSLLIALGLGMLIGLLLRIGGSRRGD